MNKIKKYHINKIGKTDAITNICFLEKTDSIDVAKFVKNYKISNFYKGNFFLKRLINKVFKYKLNIIMKWDNSFWEKVEINQFKIEINHNLKDKSISLSEFIKYSFTKKRIKDIYRYKDLITKKIDLDYPLYIDGASLKLLNPEINTKYIYMLDGSRRLMAHLLNNSRYIKVYLITERASFYEN